MTATDKLAKLVADVQGELKNAKAELQATETKLNALKQTETELVERIGNHKRNLQVKQELDAIQAKARKLLEDFA